MHLVVNLKMDYTIEPELSEDEVMAQREKIHQLASELESQLAPLGSSIGRVFTISPVVVVFVDYRGLLAVHESDIVSSYYVDIPVQHNSR